jgi:hypothetical protein
MIDTEYLCVYMLGNITNTTFTARYHALIGAIVLTGGVLVYSVLINGILYVKILMDLKNQYNYNLNLDVLRQRKRYSEDLKYLRQELEREQELRMVERNSRISAQQKLRKFLSTANLDNNVNDDDDKMFVLLIEFFSSQLVIIIASFLSFDKVPLMERLQDKAVILLITEQLVLSRSRNCFNINIELASILMCRTISLK